MQRTPQPELLDSLPPQHPDALHNRRDLRLTNRVMGNHRWLIRTLPPLLRPLRPASLHCSVSRRLTGRLYRRLRRQR